MRRLILFVLLLSPALHADPFETKAVGLVKAARAQVGVTTSYDPAYVGLKYPGGDVPRDRGVCTDVVIRALRGSGADLQKLVHEDMKKNFAKLTGHFRWFTSH